MRKKKFDFGIIRYLLDVVLIVLVWTGSMVAIKICITLSVIAIELLSFIAEDGLRRRENAWREVRDYTFQKHGIKP